MCDGEKVSDLLTYDPYPRVPPDGRTGVDVCHGGLPPLLLLSELDFPLITKGTLMVNEREGKATS